MSDQKQCPQCGTILPAEIPEELCPACLLRRGFETRTAGGVAASNVPPPTPEALASRFPQLEIVELLGRGGMGVVYKARHRGLDRWVALKILPAAAERDPAFSERFSREARALAKLDHPNIVSVFDSGEADGLFYFIMEYVDGVNLRQVLAAGEMKPEQALAIVPQICEALQYAHDQGIIHRDIKPENILVDKSGRVKIADFGLAKIIGREASDFTLTGEGEVMGTPAYMAPEQVEHPSEVDHRADIYSLGVVFYQMLTGELPLGRFAPPSRKVRIDVRLDEVVLRTLEKEPGLRYQQAGEVKTEVETIAETSGNHRPESAEPVGAKSKDDNQAGWQPLTSGWGWLVGQLFGVTFTSRRAYVLASASALGFLGCLGFLSSLPFAGAKVFSSLFCLFGFFGLAGWAFMVEKAEQARAKQKAKARVEFRSMPGTMWFAVIALSAIIVFQLLVAATYWNNKQFWENSLVSGGWLAVVGTVISAILIAGFVTRNKWAFALSLLFCAFGPIANARKSESLQAGLIPLLIDALVFIPLLLSIRWFFPPEYPIQKRRYWLWAVAIATMLAAVVGVLNPFANQSSNKKSAPVPQHAAAAQSPQQVSANSLEESAVKEIAQQFLAAIRDKDDTRLKALSCSLLPTWPEAVPVFARELRGQLQTFSKSLDALNDIAEVRMEKDFAAVKCARVEKVGGCLILFFAKTPDGWRNCSLKNAPLNAALDNELASFIESMNGELKKRAVAFVDLLAKSDFAKAHSEFDATMSAAMSEQMLATVWGQLEASGGRYQGHDAPRLEFFRGFTIVYVPCRWERAQLDLKVVYDRAGKVTGLWVVPPGASMSGSSPATK